MALNGRARDKAALSLTSRLGGGALVELERAAVDAVAEAARVARAVLEDVAEVAPAAPADDLRADHPVREVARVLHRLGHRGLREARPARPRVELRARHEQLGATARAAIDAVVMAIPVLARERPLGARLAEHLVLLGRQLLAPLRVGLLDLSRHG